MKPKKVTCGICGNENCWIEVIKEDCLGYERDVYDLDVECAKCGARSQGGNFMTGELSGWMSANAVARSNADYERQMFSAEMNDLYGRGNHPF